MPFRIHFRDLPASETVRGDCEERSNGLREEFPGTSRCEVTVAHTADGHEVHVHVTGKDLEVDASARHHGVREAIVEAFERVRRQLRKHHDKQIFERRRS
jgi:ribosome-associated translation inhibitor RaiA